MTETTAIFLVAAAALNSASVVLLVWVRRERRRLQELRYGISGRAFTESDRDAATSRLRRPR